MLYQTRVMLYQTRYKKSLTSVEINNDEQLAHN